MGGSEETDLGIRSKKGGGGKGSSRNRSTGRRELSDSKESDDIEDVGDDNEVILEEMGTDDWACMVAYLLDNIRHVPTT